MMRRIVAGLVVGALAVACTGGSDARASDGAGPAVSNLRIGEPTGPNGALYLTVQSDVPDRLVGVSTDVAGSVELHETVTQDDGTMTMSAVDAFEVDPEHGLVLEPGGKHVMLLDVQRLTAGDEATVTLEFEEAGTITLQADVVGVTEVLDEGHEHHDH